MLKLIILTTVVFGIYITVSANAATKCVALNGSSTCTGTAVGGTADWNATCNNIPITGVGVCSSTSGNVGQTAESIATGSSASVNQYCWCKMTNPAVSRFVFASRYGSGASCSYNCAYYCQVNIVAEASFRAGIFSNMQ